MIVPPRFGLLSGHLQPHHHRQFSPTLNPLGEAYHREPGINSDDRTNRSGLGFECGGIALVDFSSSGIDDQNALATPRR